MRAAEPCATAPPARAPAPARSPRAQRAADRAREHVARAGRRQLRDGRLDDAQRLAGRDDQRVGALQQHGGAGALGRLGRRSPAARRRPPRSRARAGARARPRAASAPSARAARAASRAARPARTARRRRARAAPRRRARAHRRARPRRARARGPGPATTARARAASSSTRSAPSSPCTISSGAVRGDRGALALGHAHPDDAGAARAAPPARPAPAHRSCPASRRRTSTPPASYLEPVGERGGHEREIARAPCAARAADPRARPAGRWAARSPRPHGRARARSPCPACARGRPASARPAIARRPRAPLAPSTPLGTSSATIGAASALARAASASAAPSRRPRKPLPKSASTITSASSGARSPTPNAAPPRASCGRPRVALSAAAARQTPAVEPGHVQVAGDHEAVAAVVARAAQHAHADRRRRSARAPRGAASAPALSISAIPGRPSSSMARLSSSRTSSGCQSRRIPRPC